MYVWIGTCDLTLRDSSTGYITLTSTRGESIIEKISEGYQEIARILQKFPTCKLTFLETPFYSIVANNRHRKHKTPESFTDQDRQLETQIIELNKVVKYMNTTLDSFSPVFSIDLYRTSNYRSASHFGQPKAGDILISFYTSTEFILLQHLQKRG